MEMDKLKNKKIAIIGAGHMGNALLEGLLASGLKKEQLLISNTSKDNKVVAEKADWIILAVKPIVMKQVLEDISSFIKYKLLISAAAGVEIAKIFFYVGNPKQPIVRIMPNIPVAYNNGVIGLFVNRYVLEKDAVIQVFSSLGVLIHCKKEDELDVLTIISGSGPAVVAYFIGMFAHSGKIFGLTKEVAEKVALQTFIGTLTLMDKTRQSASELQSAVATKGGITEEIIKNLDRRDLTKLFIASLSNGYGKIKKIRKNL